MSYEVGDTVTLTGVMAQNGVRVDPATVTASVSAPDGTTTAYTYPATITRQSVGVYTVASVPTLPGNYEYQFHGFDAAQKYGRTVTGRFYVRPTAFT